MRILIVVAAIHLLTFAAKAESASDFDFACAVTSSAEIAASTAGSKDRDTAFILHSFYLGRLTGRDDRTRWLGAIARRLAELREKAQSQDSYLACLEFYMKKME